MIVRNNDEADYDVIIVGARVAGSSLALLLGGRGHRVLLVDRDRFPSDTLSTHHMAAPAVGLLGRLGVLADVEACGFRRITRTRTYIDDCILEGPNAPAPHYSLAPRRDKLDAILVEHAVRRGHVEFLDRSQADGLILENGQVVGVTLRTEGKAPRSVRSKVVVGADGKTSKVAELVQAAAYNEVSALRPAYYGYYRGVTPLQETALELVFHRDMIGYIFPMEPDCDCLALELQPRHFDEFRSAPAATFEKYFKTLPFMAERMAGAKPEGKILGTRGVNNYFRKPYGPGWALTGDAGYCKDPSTGLGIGDALSQAFWLDEALHAALEGADWEASLSQFQQQRDEAMMPFYRTTIAFTEDPGVSAEAVAWLRAVFSIPSFSRPFLRAVPTALATPTIFPSQAFPRVKYFAQMFGATAEVTGDVAQ